MPDLFCSGLLQRRGLCGASCAVSGADRRKALRHDVRRASLVSDRLPFAFSSRRTKPIVMRRCVQKCPYFRHFCALQTDICTVPLCAIMRNWIENWVEKIPPGRPAAKVTPAHQSSRPSPLPSEAEAASRSDPTLLLPFAQSRQVRVGDVVFDCDAGFHQVAQLR